MTEQEKQFLIDIIENNQPIPLDFKYKLFPSPQKEYELNYAGKMRKQDLIRGEDGVQPVPLQIEKVFNGERETHSDGWKNMIVFGDNLQFLKTCNHNEDELIKDKVKGKVKLIYIDPPFGTGDEYEGNKGQKGYTAKRKSTDFVEFIRRRIILSKEILADDGVIFVRQDYHFGHYIKVVLDEVYGKENFINEIVVNRGAQSLGGSKKYSTATDSVFLYSKSQTYYFKGFTRERYKGEPTRTNMYMNGERNPRERTFLDPDGKPVILIPPPKTHWKFIQPKLDEMYKNEVVYLYFPKEGVNTGIMKKDGDSWIPVNYVPRFHFNTPKTVNSNWTDIPGYSKEKLYPTQNSEELLERVIQTCSREGDLILDFFGGSGTTAAVAEKTGRKWIICDIGKLSFYTMQKRILTIQSSKDIYNPKTLYNKMCKSFVTVNVGNYDLGKLFELGKEKYIKFVLNLFEIQAYEKEKTLNGYQVCGEKNGSYCFVWEFWKYGSDANVDTSFLEELHVNVKRRVGSRFYIIAPANAIDFISDYYEIENTRYYFLKVPYQVIQELHKDQFKKFRQPQSKNKINDVDDAIGFHFTRQPEVKSTFYNEILSLKEFRSSYPEEGTNREMENFESLSMIIIDKNFDGKEFSMTEFHFAADLLKISKENMDDQQLILDKLKHQTELIVNLTGCGDVVCAKYIDIYGNEFTEEFRTIDYAGA